jgi:hypothetical protein
VSLGEIESVNEWRNANNRPQRRRPPADRSNPAVRQRQNGAGNAHRNYERYLALAREATLNGDTIEAENFYQHAERYFRVMKDPTN